MLRKIVILASVGVLLVGCSNTKTKVDSNLPFKEVIEQTTSIEEETTQRKVILSQELSDSIKNSISKFKSMEVIQKSYSFSLINDKRTDEKCVSTTKLQVDLHNKILLTEVSIDMGNGETNYYFADDFKNNKHANKIKSSDYIEVKDGSSVSLTIDCTKIKNDYQFFKNLANNQIPEINTEGIQENNEYVFKITRPAKKTDVAGIEYDRLKFTDITYKVSIDEDGSFKPSSISMLVTFYIGSKTYGVETICEFNNYTNNELKMPEYKEID